MLRVFCLVLVVLSPAGCSVLYAIGVGSKDSFYYRINSSVIPLGKGVLDAVKCDFWQEMQPPSFIPHTLRGTAGCTMMVQISREYCTGPFSFEARDCETLELIAADVSERSFDVCSKWLQYYDPLSDGYYQVTQVTDSATSPHNVVNGVTMFHRWDFSDPSPGKARMVNLWNTTMRVGGRQCGFDVGSRVYDPYTNSLYFACGGIGGCYVGRLDIGQKQVTQMVNTGPSTSNCRWYNMIALHGRIYAAVEDVTKTGDGRDPVFAIMSAPMDDLKNATTHCRVKGDVSDMTAHDGILYVTVMMEIVHPPYYQSVYFWKLYDMGTWKEIGDPIQQNPPPQCHACFFANSVFRDS